MLTVDALTTAEKASTDQLIADLNAGITVDGWDYPTAHCRRYNSPGPCLTECAACPLQAACLVKTLRREAAGTTAPVFRAGFTPAERRWLA